MLHLPQQSGKIQRCADVDESGGEERHTDRDVDDVPDRQQASGTRQGTRLELAGGSLDLDTLQGARDPGIDVASDKTADDDNDGEQGGGAGQAVELPGGMQQDQVRSHQAGEDVELEPGGHAAPAGGAAAFADGVQGFGEQHKDETQDAQQVAE